MIRRLAWLGGSVGLCVLIVLGWSWLSRSGVVSRAFLPSPERTWSALVNGWLCGDLAAATLATTERMVLGWLLASVVGVGLGAVIGISPLARTLLGPMLEFLRPLPASALIPVGIALLGLTQAMVLAVICFGTLWPMLLATVQGFAAVDGRLHEVARLLRLSRAAVVFKMALPSAMPDILSGLRLGLTVALILSVVGEMLAGQPGLGLRILLAARAFRAPDLFAGILLLGLLGLVANTALGLVQRRALRWMPAQFV